MKETNERSPASLLQKPGAAIASSAIRRTWWINSRGFGRTQTTVPRRSALQPLGVLSAEDSGEGTVAAIWHSVSTAVFRSIVARRGAFVLLLCLLATWHDAAASLLPGNLLTNGGFEQNDRTTYTNYYPADDVAYVPLPEVVPGWTFSHSIDLYGAANAPREGTQFLDLVGGGPVATDFSIQQTFATVPGELYELSFFYGNNEFLALGMASFTASVISDLGVLWTESFTHTGDTMSVRNWTAGGTWFRADSTSTTLLFVDTSRAATDYDPTYTIGGSTLDDVKVIAVIPESGTLGAGLFVAGVVLAGLLKRRAPLLARRTIR